MKQHRQQQQQPTCRPDHCLGTGFPGGVHDAILLPQSSPSVCRLAARVLLPELRMSNFPPGNLGLAQPGQISVRCGAGGPPLGAPPSAAKEGNGGSPGSLMIPKRKSVYLGERGESAEVHRGVYSTLGTHHRFNEYLRCASCGLEIKTEPVPVLTELTV